MKKTIEVSAIQPFHWLDEILTTDYRLPTHCRPGLSCSYQAGKSRLTTYRSDTSHRAAFGFHIRVLSFFSYLMSVSFSL